MLSLARTKVHGMILPQSVTDTATTGFYLDVSDYSEGQVIVYFGAIGAADVTSISLQESDTTSAFADISGTSVTNVSQTDDNRLVVYNIDFSNNRKRYLQVQVDPGNAATLFSAVFIGVPKSASPTSASDAGSFNNGSARTTGLEAWTNI
jgi:hypothetical protein